MLFRSQAVESGVRGVMAYGSAISRSVSLMIRFGSAAIVVVCCDIPLLDVVSRGDRRVQ